MKILRIYMKWILHAASLPFSEKIAILCSFLILITMKNIVAVITQLPLKNICWSGHAGMSLIIFLTRLSCFLMSVILAVANIFPGTLVASEKTAVEFGGNVSLKVNDSNETYSSVNNGSVVLPYLGPLGEEEYKELKQKANSGGLPQVNNVTTLELPLPENK